jgi:endonuclease YncB( thermonuclease family)
MPRLVLLLLLAPLAALALPAAPADAAWRAKCVPGDPSSPRCTWWNARVTFIADGDTIDARIEGGRERQIRLTGINAMECGATRSTRSAAAATAMRSRRRR